MKTTTTPETKSATTLRKSPAKSSAKPQVRTGLRAGIIVVGGRSGIVIGSKSGSGV
jgi:hypothetical protein